jgi:hypothetical protein
MYLEYDLSDMFNQCRVSSSQNRTGPFLKLAQIVSSRAEFGAKNSLVTAARPTVNIWR